MYQEQLSFVPGGCLALVAYPKSDPQWFPTIFIWSSCLETTWRCNTDLESALRGTPTSLPEPMVHDQSPKLLFTATSFGALGKTGCMHVMDEWYDSEQGPS